MCETVSYEEPYWTVCWAWIFPYPCKKYRRVSRWCCNFRWIKENRWIFFCTLEGCADDGQLYRWTAFCFNVFGSVTFYNIRKCFDRPLTPQGGCE